MVKQLLIFLFIFYSSYLDASVYKNNCIKCHEDLPVSIDKYFYRYILKHSSETNVKKAMKEFLINPTKDKTIMPEAFVNRFGIKNKSNLSDKQINKALDDYWQKYKIFGKLK